MTDAPPPTRRRGLGTRAVLKLLSLYQYGLSPLKPGPTCRFDPVCSTYAVDAVTTYGPIRGLVMAIVRISKCGPWHPGGWDPVVPPSARRSDHSH